MVALYVRSSVFHATQKGSTIENQEVLIREFAKKHLVDEPQIVYKDVGYTGTNFCRPGFQKMIEELETHSIRCIVAKDLSRLGRNYLELGWYLELYFPQRGVRVMTVTEQYGTKKDLADLWTIGLRNIMNEWYARDIGRKVALTKAMQRQQGEYLGSVPPYGYTIEKNQRGRYLYPDVAFPVRCKIWNMRERGCTSREISQWLNRRGICTPKEYKESGSVYVTQKEKWEKEGWKDYMVRGLWKKDLLYEHQRGLPLD